MANVAALPVLLKELKLASMSKHWEPMAQKALDEQWLPQSYLAALCELEAGSRYQKRLPRQKNSWAVFGTGSAPSAWYKAVSAA